MLHGFHGEQERWYVDAEYLVSSKGHIMVRKLRNSHSSTGTEETYADADKVGC